MVLTYLRRVYSSFAVHVFDIPPRLLAFLCLLLLLFLPITRPGSYALGILIATNIFAIFAVSWDLLVGRTGQISFGHALFFGVGAYASALLYRYFRLPHMVTIPLALLIGFSVALLIGFPCLKVKGPYLALVTMAFPIILTSLVYFFRDITGGELGVSAPILFPFLTVYQQRLAEYYFTLILLLASSIILYKIANSKTGIVFISILDNELASKASGINVTKYKLMAFAISGLFGSLAGAVYVHLSWFSAPANPPTLALTRSFLPIILTLLGGIGTIFGPLVGAYIYYILDGYILSVLIRIPSEWEHAKLLVFVFVVVILIIKWPRGIAKFVVDKLQDLEEARELEEIERARRKKET